MTNVYFKFNIVESGLRFMPFVGTLLESVGNYEITVILTGEISSLVSVDVANENGNQ